MYNFENRITTVFILNSPTRTNNEVAYVYWAAELELRSWGVKDVTTTITKIILSWEDEQGHEQSVTVEGEIKTEWEGRMPLCPSSVTWDVSKNEFNVEF